jgi:hypothetical protein
MELKGAKIPPPLRNAITQQPHTSDGDAVLYICGCTVNPDNPDDLDASWSLCGRHTSTMQLSGRMLF